MAIARPTTSRGLINSVSIARLQTWLQRRDRRRLAAVAVALCVGLVVNGALSRARSTVAALGTSVAVPVAQVEIQPGETLTPANIAMEARPVGHLPSGALDDTWQGAIAATTIGAGEIVTNGRVLDGGHGLAANERAVTVPVPLAPPPVSVGDVIDLVGIVAADGPFGATARRLATGRVLVADEGAITVAMPTGEAMEVLAHLGAGSVEVLITPFEANRP